LNLFCVLQLPCLPRLGYTTFGSGLLTALQRSFWTLSHFLPVMLAAKSATLLCQFSGRLCVHNQACTLTQQDSARCSKQHILL